MNPTILLHQRLTRGSKKRCSIRIACPTRKLPASRQRGERNAMCRIRLPRFAFSSPLVSRFACIDVRVADRLNIICDTVKLIKVTGNKKKLSWMRGAHPEFIIHGEKFVIRDVVGAIAGESQADDAIEYVERCGT